MSLGRLYYLLFVLLVLAFTTCHSVRNYTPAVVLPKAEVVYPSVQIDLPVAHLTFELPKPSFVDMDEPPLPVIDITDHFCSHDINHVSSKDPKLFADGDMLLIDLPMLKKCGYSFPLPGAKMISPYAGNRKRHSGIDLKTFANDTIRAAFDGIVRMAKPYAAYGNVMVIRHFNGLETVYSHNSKHLVKQGAQVKAGQPIALVGRTGRATTEHLHFETRVNGQHFNPELLFDVDKQDLKNKTLLCVKENNRIKVSIVDPFPYQLFVQHTTSSN